MVREPIAAKAVHLFLANRESFFSIRTKYGSPSPGIGQANPR